MHIEWPRPVLIVVIDTEEEFDWSAPFDRGSNGVKAMRHLDRGQRLCDEYGVRPVYAADYPVVSQPDGVKPLLEIYNSHRCEIAAHLHPWVNPPHREQINTHNSFAGNLPADLEAEKLQVLGDRIADTFGLTPTAYKAGRYGIGPNTADILEAQGYEVDLSICPRIDYSIEGGPNFASYSSGPFWFGKGASILELPLTVDYIGLAGSRASRLHRLLSSKSLAFLHGGAVLSRLRIADLVWLSPEGYTVSEQIRLVKKLYRAGQRIFSLAFHSPSLSVGHTPYVQSQADLDKFLEKLRRFFEFFFGELGGLTTTVADLREQLSKMKFETEIA